MLVAGVVFALLIMPSAATAAWLPAVNLSEEGDFGYEQAPQVAVDASGGALALWPQIDGYSVIEASTKLAGGSWGPPIDISRSGAESREPRVAMNASGQAIAAWVRLGSQLIIEAASRTPQGSWGPPEQLFVAAGGPNQVDVAVGPAGEAVAIWTGYKNTSDYIVRAATRSSGGQWSPPVELSEGGQNAWEPRVAIDPAGNVFAVWTRWNDDGDTIIQVTEKKPGQTWGAPENLSAEGGKARDAVVDVSAERAVVLWQREEIIEAATKDMGGAWQPAVEVSGIESREPALGLDGEGNAVALWSSGPELNLKNAEVANLPLGGAWTEPITIANRLAALGARPQIAVDPAGRAVSVWSAWDGTARTVEAASGGVDGRWGEPVTISPPGSWSQRAKVAIDSAGNAAAVWRAAEPQTTQGALFDVTSPTLDSLSIPSHARAGRPAFFGVSPFDAWSSIGPASWAFGDGSTASGPSVVHTFQDEGKFNVAVTATDAAGHSTTASATVDVTPALAVSGRVVGVKRGRARLRLYCPGTAVCHGGVTLARQVKTRGGRRVPHTIGQAKLAIPGGTRATVPVKLKPKSVKFRGNARKKGLRAQITGDAVEPRTVVLKLLIPRPKSGQEGRR
jgi:PKD domain-containing protein